MDGFYEFSVSFAEQREGIRIGKRVEEKSSGLTDDDDANWLNLINDEFPQLWNSEMLHSKFSPGESSLLMIVGVR